jgi:HEAT repeat protein
MVQRMVTRLGEPRVPPTEREPLVKAVGALAAITTGQVIETMLAAPADRREPYRAAMRVAADRAVEPLLARLTDERYEIVATAAEFLGLTGSPAVIEPLLGLIRHRGEVVRERARKHEAHPIRRAARIPRALASRRRRAVPITSRFRHPRGASAPS